MKRLSLVGALLGAATLSLAQRVFLDGREIVFDDVRPQMVNGRLMVPIRGIFEQMGIAVEWDAQREVVTARKAPDLVELEVNSRVARINGQEAVLEVAPFHHRGRTLVPLRLIAQATGANVTYRDGDVHIQTSQRTAGRS
ncbi:MAG TPA: copper amine oxidase N-terminal domain-containing protein, partial [Fimbriimonadaceae bacterium]|nr:copper amine oxidase N-terminal domain-containing protein [Fimbriimonadaceae bacterium]